jgi:hypothetical protein
MSINKKTLNKDVKSKKLSKGKTANNKVNKVKSKGGMLSGDSRKKTSPNISSIADDLRIEILQSFFKYSKILDSKLIEDYINLMFNIPVINKSFRSSISSITPSLNNVTIINLQNIEISNAVLRVLNMTNIKKITTIELRKITFDNASTRNKFLEFISKNTNATNVIFDKVDADINKLLEILETFKRLENIEISRFDVTMYDYHIFIKVLLYSNAKYLTFKNNTIDRGFNTYLFTKDNNNEPYIDNEKYNIYISKEYNNRWGMIIKKDNGKFVKNIEVNIVANDVQGYMDSYKNFINDFKSIN